MSLHFYKVNYFQGAGPLAVPASISSDSSFFCNTAMYEPFFSCSIFTHLPNSNLEKQKIAQTLGNRADTKLNNVWEFGLTGGKMQTLEHLPNSIITITKTMRAANLSFQMFFLWVAFYWYDGKKASWRHLFIFSYLKFKYSSLMTGELAGMVLSLYFVFIFWHGVSWGPGRPQAHRCSKHWLNFGSASLWDYRCGPAWLANFFIMTLGHCLLQENVLP